MAIFAGCARRQCALVRTEDRSADRPGALAELGGQSRPVSSGQRAHSGHIGSALCLSLARRKKPVSQTTEIRGEIRKFFLT